MSKVEILHHNESTPDIINRIISREKENDPHFDDAFYVIDLGDLYKKMKVWREQLPRVAPFFAVKCNDDMTILSTLVKLGSSFDCSSKLAGYVELNTGPLNRVDAYHDNDEMSRVLQLGASPSSIVYAHPIKQPNFLRYAAEKGVDKMVFDSEEELKKIKSIYPAASYIAMQNNDDGS